MWRKERAEARDERERSERDGGVRRRAIDTEATINQPPTAVKSKLQNRRPKIKRWSEDWAFQKTIARASCRERVCQNGK